MRRDVDGAVEHALRDWLDDALDYNDEDALPRRICLRLDIRVTSLKIQSGGDLFRAALFTARGSQLLDVVHAALELLCPLLDEDDHVAAEYAEHVEELDQVFLDAGLAYRVASDHAGLMRRLDEAVVAASEQAIGSANEATATLLQVAWRSAFGLHPNPTTAYRDAVRAVEELACPLVLAKAASNNSATLGTVRDHLRAAPGKWRFVLLDKDDNDSVDPLVAMLDRLWTGQVSRHGGGSRSRDQTQAEAEAAVHLAVTLVQLLSTGALARRSTP